MTNAEFARERQAFVDELLAELHLERWDKDVPVGQLGIFLGIWIDSHKGRLKLTDAKWAKLLADLRLVMTWDEATPRMVSKVRGKLINYSECIVMIRPVSVPFSVFHRASSHRWGTGYALASGRRHAGHGSILAFGASSVVASWGASLEIGNKHYIRAR